MNAKRWERRGKVIIKQGNREYYLSAIRRGDYETYYIITIDGKSTTGRQASYPHVKCETCGRIVGTQFGAHLKHFNTHKS